MSTKKNFGMQHVRNKTYIFIYIAFGGWKSKQTFPWVSSLLPPHKSHWWKSHKYLKFFPLSLTLWDLFTSLSMISYDSRYWKRKLSRSEELDIFRSRETLNTLGTLFLTSILYVYIKKSASDREREREIAELETHVFILYYGGAANWN